MAGLTHVFDGTRENFQQLVLENSRKGIVLVNYWTPNAGPCFKLWQVLEGLSQEYQGRFLLVNVNTDTQKPLARENGITSVPTVKIYQQGNVVESIHGAQSETSLRSSIDKYAPPAQNTAIARAIHTYQTGQADAALELLAEASSATPNDPKPCAIAIKLLLREKRYADIDVYCSALTGIIQAEPEIDTLRVHAKMLQLAEQAPPVGELDRQLEDVPDDLDSALNRAAVAMVQDDYETALTRLFQVLQLDPQYCDELPRKAMLVLFSLLGDKHELTKAFQDSMREVLH